MIEYQTIQFDPEEYINALPDRDRKEWIKALLKSIQEEGTIDEIRAIVASREYDDQP